MEPIQPQKVTESNILSKIIMHSSTAPKLCKVQAGLQNTAAFLCEMQQIPKCVTAGTENRATHTAM